MGILLNALLALIIVIISFIGIRLASYWWSFLLHWRKYRINETVSISRLRQIDTVPNVKFQITTRGSEGSSEVILRGIRQIYLLLKQDPEFFGNKLSVELITESQEQALLVTKAYEKSGLFVDALVVPKDYETPKGTKLKARGLHFAVENRRKGWNDRKGRTFIVHYDEESVMLPEEIKKLLYVLARTEKKILEGPIYYPLEYRDASLICRSMEANRPVGCFECRHVMEQGIPIHLHGSNLVVEESLENEIGWDIGCLEDQPFIAEDYVFGMNAFVEYGRSIFGWHGCVMIEQPPFSIKSAFKQRYRWIFGVLQGMTMVRRLESYQSMNYSTKMNVLWGTRLRIASFALGAVVGVLALILMPVLLSRVTDAIIFGYRAPVFWLLSLWLGIVGFLWLGSVLIGLWYNLQGTGLSSVQKMTEAMKALTVAPFAGLVESSAGLWAVIQWNAGKREVHWNPTPKTKLADVHSNHKENELGNERADNSSHNSLRHINYKLLAKETEAPMPIQEQSISLKDVLLLLIFLVTGILVLLIYIVLPFSAVANYFELSFALNLSFGALILIGLSMIVLDILKQTSRHTNG